MEPCGLSDARWRIELLGGLRAVGAGGTLTRFRTQKTGALLAYLAYHREREHPREELTEVLWPEDDRDSSRHKLNVAVSSLRGQLEPPGVPDGSVLRTSRITVQLNPAAITTDVAEFGSALQAGEQAPGDGERAAHLTRAVELYQGRLLAGFYEEWILPEEQRLNERYFAAVQQLVSLLTKAGRLDQAMQYALAATGIDPLREEAHREVIQLYYRLGHPDAARKQYLAVEKLLAEGLGIRPAASTMALLRDGGDAAPLLNGASHAPIRNAVPPRSGVDLEADGGAVPLGSRFYVLRPADAGLQAAIRRGDSLVLLKGATQVGKTSLLARALQQARSEGARIVRTDFQLLNAGCLETAEALLRALAEGLAEQLGLEPQLPPGWGSFGGPNLAFQRYLRHTVLDRIEAPVVWGMDGVDRLFTCGFSSEIFALFRSWHNERAFDPEGPWGRLTLAIAYATEAHLFITDPNRSPFNVGTRLELDDFTQEQVRDLNERYGGPLRGQDELERFHRLLNGHPYLVRRALHELAVTGAGVEALEARAHRDEWIFGNHLRRLRALLARDSELNDAVRRVLCGERCPTPEAFYRLRSAGVLAGETAEEACPRCELYAVYLRRHLLAPGAAA